jgi:predicted MPP superfamily phosphohydrolase
MLECELLYQSMTTRPPLGGLRPGQDGVDELHRDPASPRTLSRRTVLKSLAGGGAVVLVGASGYGFFGERHAVGLTEATIPVAGLPPELAGLRIGLLTDVHRSRWVSASDVDRGVRLLSSAQPDLIVLGGDYVTWGERAYVGPSAEALAPLTAPHGVFAVLGNHDDDRDMPAALAARGVTVLKDARTTITIRGRLVTLAGIRFWTRRPRDIASLVANAPGTVMLLAHDPRRLAEAAGLNIPLVLSGHTHGGQVVLPVLGPIAAEKFPVVYGAARQGDTTLFVSRGLGTVYVPVRVNCPPEVALLTLIRPTEG